MSEFSRKKRKNKIVSEATIFLIVMMTIPVLNFCLSLYLNLATVPLSFQDFNVNTSKYEFIGLRNYVRLMQEISKSGSIFLVAIKNSLLFFLLNNAVLLPLSIIFSFFLNKKMPLAGFFRLVFFMPSIISAVVLTMLFMFIFDDSIGFMSSIFKALNMADKIPQFGWFGDEKSALNLVLLYCFWVGIGGNILLLSGAINRIPPELIEVGKIEGLSVWGELFKITFPLIGGTISVLFMQGVTVIFTMFLPVKLLTNGGPVHSTYTLALYITNAVRDDGNLTIGATVGIMCAIVGTPLVLAFKKLMEKIFPEYQY